MQKKTMKRTSRKKATVTSENILEDDYDYAVEDIPTKLVNKKSEDEDDLNVGAETALFSGMSDFDDVLYEKVQYQEDPENLHPAEIAARYEGDDKNKSVGGSHKQILKDLRKLVFSVPLLPQEEVAKLFDQIDKCVFPTVYKILESSLIYFEEVIQVVVKVAAGNTYGKNIYEKANKRLLGEEEEIDPKEAENKGTYKDHEIEFLENSYDLLRLFANQNMTDQNVSSVYPVHTSTERAMKKCAFIRGVYEDVLKDFVDNTKHYERLHWLALEAKFKDDHQEYHKIIHIISHLDKSLKLNRYGFYITRESNRIYKQYMQLRAAIMTPYLRSVYSTAKNTASNAPRILDNFQNGSIGLMRAVSCYSVKRLASFASVAKSWIKQSMLLSIKEESNFVKLPVSTWQAYTQLEKIKNKIGANDDDVEAIAKAAKMPLKKAKSVYYTVKIAQVFSLNRTYDSEEKLTLEDIMTDEDRLGASPDPFANLLREYCEVSNLNDKELKVLALRHGMIDLIPHEKQVLNDAIEEALMQNMAALGYHLKTL